MSRFVALSGAMPVTLAPRRTGTTERLLPRFRRSGNRRQVIRGP